MSDPSEEAPAEDALVEAVHAAHAAVLPLEHDLIGSQVQAEAALPAEANEQVWESAIYAKMTMGAISAASADSNGVSTENILSWSKSHYKGLSVYFSPEYKPSDPTSLSEWCLNSAPFRVLPWTLVSPCCHILFPFHHRPPQE